LHAVINVGQPDDADTADHIKCQPNTYKYKTCDNHSLYSSFFLVVLPQGIFSKGRFARQKFPTFGGVSLLTEKPQVSKYINQFLLRRN
jgi:hypothetical protein